MGKYNGWSEGQVLKEIKLKASSVGFNLGDSKEAWFRNLEVASELIGFVMKITHQSQHFESWPVVEVVRKALAYVEDPRETSPSVKLIKDKIRDFHRNVTTNPLTLVLSPKLIDKLKSEGVDWMSLTGYLNVKATYARPIVEADFYVF